MANVQQELLMVTSRLNLSRNAARQSTGRGRSFEPCCETIGTWGQKSSRPWDPRHAKLESCHRKRFDHVSGEEKKSWGICDTLLNVWRRSVSQNLKSKLSKLTQKRAKVLLNLTQIYLEVGFMAEAAAVAAENVGHIKVLLWRIWRRQNLLLLLLSLLPGCPSSRVLLLLLTARCSNECVQNIILQSALKSWKYAGRLLTERTAGSIGDRHCSQGQGWDVTKSKMIQQNSMRARWN